MIHYHGTPITPRAVLHTLAGRFFCTSFAAPNDVAECHRIGQGNMLDNGAFSSWRGGKQPDWDGYYAWAEPWLDWPTTWAVIPDVIDGDEEANDRLLREWFQQRLPKGAPVWHMHESIDRLRRLCHGYERVCIGSSGRFSVVGSDSWHRRMTEAMNDVCGGSGVAPTWLHMLRGMSLSGDIYPFASVDSTDVAQNHNRPHNTAAKIADRWDGLQCTPHWQEVALTAALEGVA